MRTSERSAPRLALRARARNASRDVEATIPLHRPTFSGREWRYLRECLDSGWVSAAGPFVGRFERAVARYVGSRYAIATVTGSAALHVALQLVGVRPGDHVLVPDLTFIAPLHAVRQCGADPLLIDVDAETGQIDPAQVEAFLSTACTTRHGGTVDRRTRRCVRALLVGHLLGLPCDIERLVEIARRYGLAVVEDAAQAIGVRYRARHVGTFGDVGVLSFNGNKTITAGGGGMLLTADDRFADRARRLIHHATPKTTGRRRGELAFNYRLSSLQAALGLAQVEQLEAVLDRQRRNAGRYARLVHELDGVEPLLAPRHVRPSFWLYPVRLQRPRRRDEVVRSLATHGVEAKPLWRPMHMLAANRDCRRGELVHAIRLYAQTVCLPTHASLTTAELDRCLSALRSALNDRSGKRASS